MDSQKIEIVDFTQQYKTVFKNLNEEWIKSYFKIEASDSKVLGNPQKYIIDCGGEILVALHKSIPVGVCALIKMNDSMTDYELAKMAVSPTMRGKGIGYLLGNAIIKKAQSIGASSLYLESNTILESAIYLYKKLGFVEVERRATPYKRCNIQMKLVL